ERRRRLAPFAESAQQARLRERRRRTARIALRGDPEAQRRLAALPLLLERAPLQVRERRERGRIADVRGGTVGGLDCVVEPARVDLELGERDPRGSETRVGVGRG